jgi:hypothetical protein
VAGAWLPYPDDADNIPEAAVEDFLGGHESGSICLYDGLSDVHGELKYGFQLLEAGRPEAEAVFYWRLGFWNHWGYHNADALRFVHTYVALYLGG